MTDGMVGRTMRYVPYFLDFQRIETNAMKNLLLFTALLGLLAWSGCKQCDDPTNPECENYDPCYVTNPLSPDFSIEEVVGITLQASFFTDTVLTNGFSSVRFTAMHGYQSYSWQIGTDDREFTDRVVSLQFLDPIGTISVRLIAKKYDWQLDPTCRPDDDGLDTMVRQLTVVKRKETCVEGTYFGQVERKNGVRDTLTVKVDWRTSDISHSVSPPQLSKRLSWRNGSRRGLGF